MHSSRAKLENVSEPGRDGLSILRLPSGSGTPHRIEDVEHNRNDVVFSFQDNRNPFIDHPEWVACLFMDECDAECPQDLDGDGQVEAFDLAILLGSWGPCS